MARSHTRTVAIAAMVKRDYAAVAGKIIMLDGVTGYNAQDNAVDRTLDPPLAFRVSAEVPDSEINRVCDEWVDPVWDVVPLEPKDPQISDLGSFFCYGPSYHLFSEKSEAGDQVQGSPVCSGVAAPEPVAAAPVPAAPQPVSQLPPTKAFRVHFKISGIAVVNALDSSKAMTKAYEMNAGQLAKHGVELNVAVNRIEEVA